MYYAVEEFPGHHIITLVDNNTTFLGTCCNGYHLHPSIFSSKTQLQLLPSFPSILMSKLSIQVSQVNGQSNGYF